MQVFVIINIDGMKVNADVNAKNWLTMEHVTYICECECDKSCDVGEYLKIKTVSVEKSWLIN